jgi:hypothetical protein
VTGAPHRQQNIVSLAPHQGGLYFEHLQRLDPEARRRRFYEGVQDFHLALESGAAVSDDRVCLGFLEQGIIRGGTEPVPCPRDRCSGPHQDAT